MIQVCLLEQNLFLYNLLATKFVYLWSGIFFILYFINIWLKSTEHRMCWRNAISLIPSYRYNVQVYPGIKNTAVSELKR